MVIGLDANAVIGAKDPNDHPNVVGRHCLGTRVERGEKFASFAHANKWTVANTMFRKQESFLWTHRLFSTGTTRQIDYVLADRALRTGLRYFRISDVFLKSDRRPLMLVLDLLSIASKKDGRCKKHSSRTKFPYDIKVRTRDEVQQ